MRHSVIYDASGNIVRKVHFDEVDGDAVFETVEDFTDCVESVKVLRDHHKDRGDMKHVARVPVTVVERAMREGWFHDQKAWNKFLNDPDNKDFRVWGGNL
jgi:hypothetical protein